MTSKEMEARSGVPRANIRYYEAEGLLAPARSGNGYRDYSEEDLRTLEKIKLLRRLGVTIEALRALRDGRAELSAVLDRRLAEVGGEQAALGRVERVCGDLRRTGATFTGLDPGRYLADLDAPALPGEGGPWWEKASASALPETDRLPTVCSASRRLFARMFDEFLAWMLLVAGLCLLGYNPTRAALAISFAGVVLLGVLEPLSLHLWGTTPGKALLGMRLAGMDGKNLPYSEGVTRYLMMLWMGLGFYIPILSLVMILRSAWRCWKEEPQPWDDGVAYTAKPFRLRYAASLILTVLLVLIVGEAVNTPVPASGTPCPSVSRQCLFLHRFSPGPHTTAWLSLHPFLLLFVQIGADLPVQLRLFLGHGLEYQSLNRFQSGLIILPCLDFNTLLVGRCADKAVSLLNQLIHRHFLHLLLVHVRQGIHHMMAGQTDKRLRCDQIRVAIHFIHQH